MNNSMKSILHSFRYKILTVAMLLSVSACTEKFDEINTNPNAPSTATADLFLPHGIQSAVDAYWGGSLGMDIGNLISQYWARIQYTDIDQYSISSDVYSGAWQTFHIEALPDYQRIYKLGVENKNPNYQAVAMIMRSWVFSLLTDIYGDIPYTQSVQGLEGVLQPKYDTQKEVYAGIIKELKAANDMIDATDKTKAIAGDILFANDMNKWKKFANSLSLRLLNRMLSKTDASMDVKTEINRILGDPVKYPVIGSVAETIQLNYLDATNNNNPINQNRKSRDDHRVSATLVNKLAALKDARLAVYADKPADGGDYKGVPNGLSNADANSLGLSKTSKVGAFFVAATAPGVILSYAELLFIKAEMAYKGITAAGTFATNYTNGITASHTQYKLTVGADYLAANAPKSGEDGYKQLMEQKWIAMFGQGIEAWTEFRRTGYPELKPSVINVNAGVIPTRLPYPGSEESLNFTNFSAALKQQGGANDMKLKLWIAK